MLPWHKKHFLMSAAVRTLSLIDLCDLSEDAAHKMLWKCGGKILKAPVCPYWVVPPFIPIGVAACSSARLAIGSFSDERNLTRAPQDCVSNSLMAFCLFVNAAKGLSSLQLSRNLGLHAKTAFVLLHNVVMRFSACSILDLKRSRGLLSSG